MLDDAGGSAIEVAFGDTMKIFFLCCDGGESAPKEVDLEQRKNKSFVNIKKEGSTHQVQRRRHSCLSVCASGEYPAERAVNWPDFIYFLLAHISVDAISCQGVDSAARGTLKYSRLLLWVVSPVQCPLFFRGSNFFNLLAQFSFSAAVS